MGERKAVIKSADMSEDMQQDAVDCASQALEKYNIEKVSFSSHIPARFHLFIRISQHILRKSSTRNITLRGTALLDVTLVLMLHTRPSISYTSTWAKLLSSCSSPVKISYSLV